MLQAFCALFVLSALVAANKYEQNARVEVEVNTVGPYNNPTERYMYFKKLPFCEPEDSKKTKMGSALAGDRARSSDYEVFFKKEETHKVLCEKSINQNEIKKFRDAV